MRNIDSKSRPRTQFRFKYLAVRIRLLRLGGSLTTFATKSVKSRHSRRKKACPLYPQKRPRKRNSAKSFGPKADSCAAASSRYSITSSARFSETPIGSGAAAPKAAIAPRDHAEARLITGQGGVFRHLEFLLDRVIAFAVLAELFDLGRGFLVQREHVLRILLGAKPSARLSRMAGDQPIPIHCQHLLDEDFRFERIEIDHSATREGADRDGVDHEDDLLLWQPHHDV